MQELDSFSQTHADTRVYIHQVTVDGQEFAVEWQFATTDRSSGTRTAVSDAIMGRVQDGKIILWKEYLDGRVPSLQREGQLELEEGEEPFPGHWCADWLDSNPNAHQLDSGNIPTRAARRPCAVTASHYK